MASPSRRCQPEQDGDDKSVMKVTLVSCKGAHPSQSVVNVHIDGINPNVNTPQINKFMRRLTKNVVKIQNEIESQKNPHPKKTDSTTDSPTGSGSQDSESTEYEGRIYPTATNACEREVNALPACSHQRKDLSAKEETSPKVKSNAPAKSTNATTDIVEIYSNKLINQSYDSVFIDEWMKHDSSDTKPVPIQPLCRRKKSLSCTNIATNTFHVYPVDLPGSSRQKADDEVDQEDNDTDDISLRTGSVENNSLCSCRVSAGDIIVQADDMQLGSSSCITLVLSGKSSKSSAFNCCASPNKKRSTTTTTTKSTERKSGSKRKNDSTDEVSTVTDTSQGFNSEDGRSTTGSGNSGISGRSEGKKVGPTEKEILEKQRALLSEEAKNEELIRKTDEQNKRIYELNKKLDELNKKNSELNRARAEDMRKKEDEWQKKVEREEGEYAKRIERNYPGNGRNKIVRTITKGNRSNIEAIDALFANKLPKPTVRRVSPVASSRRDGYPSSSRSQPPHDSAVRGVRGNEDRLAPPVNFDARRNRDQSKSPAYSIYDPSDDFSDRSRGPDNTGNQPRRQGYDPSLYRSRDPGSMENQPGRQGYDPSLYRSRDPGSMENQPGRQGYDPNLDRPRDQGSMGNQLGRQGYDPILDRSRDPGSIGNQPGRQGYDPILDRSRDPGSMGNQPGRQGYDPILDRSRDPGSMGNQPGRQNYDSSLEVLDRSRGKYLLENQPSGQGHNRNRFFPRNRSQGTSSMSSSTGPRQMPNAPIPVKECKICGSSSDKDVTFCCCFKKASKQNERSRLAGTQKPCPCCGQCPPRCICEKGDLAPISLYQNTASVPNIPAQIGDGIFPPREFKPNDKPFPDGANVAAENTAAVSGDMQLEAGDTSNQKTQTDSEGLTPNSYSKSLDTNTSSENFGTAISTADLHKTQSKNSSLPMLSDKRNGPESEQTPPKVVQNNIGPQADTEMMEKFVKERLGCDSDFPARVQSGVNPSQEFKSKEDVGHVSGVVTIKTAAAAAATATVSTNGEKRSKGSKLRKQGTVLKYLCPCCVCQDSQQSLVNAEGVAHTLSGKCLDSSQSSQHIVKGISSAGLHKKKSEPSSDGNRTSLQMLSCQCDGLEGGHAQPGIVHNNIGPQADTEKMEQFVKEMLGCDCDLPARVQSGINQSQELKSKGDVGHDGGVVTIKSAAAVTTNGDRRSGGSKPRKQGTVLKYLCPCCCCQDSQQSLANAERVAQNTSGKCLDSSQSSHHIVKGSSSAGLNKKKSTSLSFGDQTSLQMLSCQCDGQEGGQVSPGVVHNNVDQQTDNDKKAQFVQERLGCDCGGPDNMQTVHEKFVDESQKEQFIQERLSCACDEPKVEDFPSEELMSFENYEEQYFDDTMGIDYTVNGGHHAGHRGRYRADVGHAGNGVPHNCACEGAYQPKDLDGKRNLVERRLDRHGFGNRHDCEKKRALVQTRMSCVCDAEENCETLKKQRILEGRLDCKCRPVGNLKKMREYVRSGLGCGAQCDEHAEQETRRKQAIVEQRLGCSANHLRDTGKKSAYLKRRLDCICDDASTQAKKQQAYLERFLTCGCTDVVKDIQKKKQFVDDFLKCKCDKESEVKKMQMYLERFLTCDCEHIKDRNMDKKIDYMNKVMSCDGPGCKAEKDGKELVTVCGDGKASVAAVAKRLPASPRALGSDSLLCCCGSGESFLGPCRCDSMSDVEKTSARRHRRDVSSTVAGGLICRCGKQGDSECVCDGVKSPAKSSSTSQGRPKAKCKCRHRLDGICRCRDKTGKNPNPNASRSYMINQVPCNKATSETAKSVSDSILCSAKLGDCNCELDPESCFCQENSAAAKWKDGRAGNDMGKSVTLEPNSSEEDEEISALEEKQEEVDQFGKNTKESPVDETVGEVDDRCKCKKNCSGRCKCDIDGSDCREGQQARRCFCDAEGPETCICAKTASPRHRAPPQGTCYCNKDASGQCKCDKDEDKGRSTHSIANSGVLIELKNMNSKPEVTISGLEARKGKLKVDPGSTSDTEGVSATQESFHEHDTQVHFVKSNQNDLFVVKECDEEFSSESCLDSTDETTSINELEYSPSYSKSGKMSASLSASGNTFVYSPSQSESDNVCANSTSQSASDNEYETPPNEAASCEFMKSESTEQTKVPQDEVCSLPTASSVASQDTQSRPSSDELKTMHAGPSQSAQVRNSSTEMQTKRVRTAAIEGPSRALGVDRRPKWYHMFHLSSGKGRKRSKSGSQDGSETSADADDRS